MRLSERLEADAELIHNNGITRKLRRHRVAALLREAAELARRVEDAPEAFYQGLRVRLVPEDGQGTGMGVLKDGDSRMNVVFSCPIKGICTRPGLWVESGVMAQLLAYFQKPKWIKDDTAWEKFLRGVFANVRLEVRDRDALREVMGRILEDGQGGG